MKLRKMITVSAAALMLAGVGASATNTGAPVHASKRTVRISKLTRRANHLNYRIKVDKTSVKQIKGEIAKLSRKNIRRGKRSKNNVNRHKRTNKGSKKSQQKAAQQKIMKQYQAQLEAASKQRTPVRINLNGEVYNAEINGLNQIVSRAKKPSMTYKSYMRKHGKAVKRARNRMNSLQRQLSKIKSQAKKTQFVNSSKVKRAEKALQRVNVAGVQVPKAQNRK